MNGKDQEQTVEFFRPRMGTSIAPYLKAESKQGIHHVGRYEWAALALQHYRPGRVLDIACGAGYGSAMIAGALPGVDVLGGDYDARAIECARKDYDARPGCSYTIADITTWRGEHGPLGSFDAVVSFDTIEHLSHREIALMRICDNLSDAGVLLLSTPCAHNVTRLNPAWEHHKCEYSHTDLYALLRRFFHEVLPPEHPRYVGLDYWRDVVNKDKVRYPNIMNPVICVGPVRVQSRARDRK